MTRLRQEFQTVRSEGGLLPPDLLRRLLDRHSTLAGTRPEDYGLSPGERVNEVITHSWNRLRRHYGEFRAAAANVSEGEAATGLTNDKWSLPLLRELGFGFLPVSAGPEIGGRTYAIRRFFGPVAVHLVGRGLSLDRRAAGQRGAAAANPNGLVQEFLNRNDAHLWAIVSSGLRLRTLRDNRGLSRQSYQHALRDVIGRCLYGVDMNPMAAELCRMGLWLEALEPGKPLSFLDHRIRVGNSLLGTTPELIQAGLPDEAFKSQQGDHRKICTGIRKRIKVERECTQRDLGYLMVAEPSAEYDTLASRSRWIDESPDDTLGEVRGEGGGVSVVGGIGGVPAPVAGCGCLVCGACSAERGVA